MEVEDGCESHTELKLVPPEIMFPLWREFTYFLQLL